MTRFALNPLTGKFDLIGIGGGGGGSFYEQPVSIATTTNLTATYNNGTAGTGATLTNSGAQAAFTADGVTPSVNSRVLVKDQTDETENGIYIVTVAGDGSTNWVLTRSTDYNQPSEIDFGDLIAIIQGDTQASTIWMQTSVVSTIGTDDITFALFQGNFGVNWIFTSNASYNLVANQKVCATGAGVTTFNLPPVSQQGQEIWVKNSGSGTFTIPVGASQAIRLLDSEATSGESVTSQSVRSALRLVCVVANLEWEAISVVGNFEFS